MGDNVNIVSVKEEPKIANKDIETKIPSESVTSRKNVKEEKARKKDDRSVEQVLKALNSLDTTEEKLAAMCKKYADTVDENRKLQLTLKQTEKRLIVLQREKEQLQTEHSKAVLTRSRLESLCRELQRQNKAVKDESLLKIREEEEKRKEVSAKFQSTLADVTALMQQNNEKNCKLREDNLEMTKKFKSVCEQYELREQHVEKISKQLQLESQLAEARLSKAKMETAAEKETLLREKQQLVRELVECRAKMEDLQATETSLRSQISLYTNKYDEFQNALSRSNDVFEDFKGEMEKMSKKIFKLEKETSSWKQRWEKSHQALLEMAADKQQRDSELQLTNRQLTQLQKLCRTLQAERTSLLAQLKASAKPSIAEGAVPETGEGDEKNASCLPDLESALSGPQGVVEGAPVSELAPQVVPETCTRQAIESGSDQKGTSGVQTVQAVPESVAVDSLSQPEVLVSQDAEQPAQTVPSQSEVPESWQVDSTGIHSVLGAPGTAAVNAPRSSESYQEGATTVQLVQAASGTVPGNVPSQPDVLTSSQTCLEDPTPVQPVQTVPGTSADYVPSQPDVPAPVQTVPGTAADHVPSQPDVPAPVQTVPGTAADHVPSQPEVPSPVQTVPDNVASQPEVPSPVQTVPDNVASQPGVLSPSQSCQEYTTTVQPVQAVAGTVASNAPPQPDVLGSAQSCQEDASGEQTGQAEAEPAGSVPASEESLSPKNKQTVASKKGKVME